MCRCEAPGIDSARMGRDRYASSHADYGLDRFE